MNNSCEIQAGFFSLRRCDEVAATRCGRCRRAMCGRHTAPDDINLVCLDCAARLRDEGDTPGDDSGRSWLYRQRQRHQSWRAGDNARYRQQPFWVTDSYDDTWHHAGGSDHDWDDTDGSYYDS